MLMSKGQEARVLLTTPDYPPKLGGLSTFTLGIEKSLNHLGIAYDLLHWQSIGELKKASLKKKYDVGLHIHFMGSHYLNRYCREHINFFHGSEILFTSPHPLKRLYKSLSKWFFLRRLEKARYNIAISEFTLKKIESLGLKIDYSRDLIFHNCLDFKGQKELILKSLEDSTWNFVCVARDVPHKNLEGAYRLCLEAAKATGKDIIFYSPKEFPHHPMVKSIAIADMSDEKRDDLYKRAHFNLLLSLDHSKRGFYEGFGLTVLEAGRFATPSIVSPYGGLPEACHHNQTGWVIPLKEKNYHQFFKFIDNDQYQRIATQCYQHTIQSHHGGLYDNLLKGVLP